MLETKVCWDVLVPLDYLIIQIAHLVRVDWLPSTRRRHWRGHRFPDFGTFRAIEINIRNQVKALQVPGQGRIVEFNEDESTHLPNA